MTTPSPIAILGSAGSIGLQAEEVCRHMGIPIEAICSHSNIAVLEQQIRRSNVAFCAVYDTAAATALRKNVADCGVKIFAGGDGIHEMIGIISAPLVINSIVGSAGLLPTLAAIQAGRDIALANKESLVCAGDIVMAQARERGVRILPVDSEHSAVWQCLGSRDMTDMREVRRIILTASGGPFFGRKGEELHHLAAADALAHPTWSMGRKISVDSATLMNKGLEVIEAAHLFGVRGDMIDVVVHRQSIIHSMVEFADASVIAQLSTPDMRECIQYALTYPHRHPSLTAPLDFTKISTLTFDQPDTDTFPLLKLAFHALKQGGVIPAVLNGANEAAVDLFLEGKITFGEIAPLIHAAVEGYANIAQPTIDEILAAEKAGRARAMKN
ncbi:MAG: 1-deoxy-D-xylulose-5-phosphate reductoisomerase [Oscillospiraceae bacterium]|nr:1-deoxy-D-xylulose-5-phosphate reductoisomerase [Oscillospiraceae bacterium]